MKWLQIAIYGVACYLYGSILFWLPDALWHLWRGGSFAGIDCIILTNVLPVIVAAGVPALMRSNSRRIGRMLISIAMILGILTTGPVWMMFNAGFSGGAGFAKGVPWRGVGILHFILLLRPP